MQTLLTDTFEDMKSKSPFKKPLSNRGTYDYQLKLEPSSHLRQKIDGYITDNDKLLLPNLPIFVPVVDNPLIHEFNRLATQWKNETEFESSTTKIVSNPHYLRIIAFGESVIPLILRDLQKRDAHWFVALQALSGEYNVGTGLNGQYNKIVDAWINWGREGRYI